MKKFLGIIVLFTCILLSTFPAHASENELVSIQEYNKEMKKLFLSYGIENPEMINPDGKEFITQTELDHALTYTKNTLNRECAKIALENESQKILLYNKTNELLNPKKIDSNTKGLMPIDYNSYEYLRVSEGPLYQSNYTINVTGVVNAQNDTFLELNSYNFYKAGSSKNVVSWNVSGLTASINSNRTAINVQGTVTTDFSYTDPLTNMNWQTTNNKKFSVIFTP